MRIALFLFVFLVSASCFGQTGEQLLDKAIAHAHPHPDSTLFYADALEAMSYQISLDEAFRLNRAKASALQTLTQYSEAGLLFEANKGIAQKLRDSTAIHLSEIDFGAFFWRRGQYFLADSIFGQLETRLEPTSPAEVQTEFHAALGLLKWNQGHHDLALNHAIASFNFAEQSADVYNQARALNLMGLVHMNKENYPTASAFIRQSAAINEKNGCYVYVIEGLGISSSGQLIVAQ